MTDRWDTGSSHTDPYNADYYKQRRAGHTRTDLNDAVRTVEVQSSFVVRPQAKSALRDVIYEDGVNVEPADSTRVSLSAAPNNDEYEVTTPATAGASTGLETARIGQYRPGSTSVAGIHVRVPDAPAGKIEWGYFREPRTVEGIPQGENGLFWRYQSDDNIAFVIKRRGVETVFEQSEWAYKSDDPRVVTDENGDVSGRLYGYDGMDGEVSPTHKLDVSEGYVYRIDFAWYGGGVIVPKILTMDKYGAQAAIDLFAFEPRGQTSFTEPSQPVTCRIDNQSTGEATTAYVAGRQYSTVGGFNNSERDTSHYEPTVSLPGTQGDEGFILAFRRKPAYQGVEVGLRDVLADLSNPALIGEILYPDFGSQTPSWETPSQRNDPTETALEVATEDTDGNPLTIDTSQGVRYNGALLSGQKNSIDPVARGGVNFPVPRETPVVFVGTNTTGSSTTVDLNPRFAEEW